MHVTHCRFWWCSKCQAVFEKEDLAMKLVLYGGTGDVIVLGTRTCGHCGSTYQVKDIYAGKHDVPRQFWGQLQQPVELPKDGTSVPPAQSQMQGQSYEPFPTAPAPRRRVRRPRGSPLSVAMGWLLFVVALAGGLAVLGHVLVKPLLGD